MSIGQYEDKDSSLRLIGIGASAGGVEALQLFFSTLPEQQRLSFAIIQHLSPNHKSLMPEILSKRTTLSIQQISEPVKVQPGHIYLLSPGKEMVLKDGYLYANDKPVKKLRPIDTFFYSLAREQGPRSVGIILSGTGSDGTKGLKAIKEAGGTVLAQSGALFDSMPTSAIAEGIVDVQAAIEELPFRLIEHLAGTLGQDSRRQEGPLHLGDLLQLLKVNTGTDFSSYKEGTLRRRLQHRIQLLQLQSFQDYLLYLQEHEEEYALLKQEFLIGVTQFFRDEEAWDVLKEQVLPQLFEPNRPTIKVWVVGCSTGEEAYSLALLLEEEKKKHYAATEIRIFATDLSANAIHRASLGIYPESIAKDVPQPLLEQYFSLSNGEYKVHKALRKNLIFSQHDALQNPPFGHLDLVLCRNMAIYLKVKKQQQLLQRLNFSLKAGGFLFIGPSESLGAYSHLYQPVSINWNIFQLKPEAKATPQKANILYQVPTITKNTSVSHLPMRLSHLLHEELLRELSASCFLLDENFRIIHASGQFGGYLRLPEQHFSLELSKLLPKGMSATLALVLNKCKREGLEEEAIITTPSTSPRPLEEQRVTVRPTSLSPNNKGYIVLIRPDKRLSTSTRPARVIATPENHSNDTFRELELELYKTQESLQLSIEQGEFVRAELQSTNEELLTSNEELQSTNEELQSVNEELHTVNDEHQSKISELADRTAELDSLLHSTDLGTIFLDRSLCIRKYTQASLKYYPLTPNDHGRPLRHFAPSFSRDLQQELLQHVQEVIETGTPHESEHSFTDEEWFLLRISPFCNKEEELDGTILTFIDITRLKRAENQVRENEARLQAYATAIPDIALILGEDGSFLDVLGNKDELLYRPREELMGRNLNDVFPPTQAKLFQDLIERTLEEQNQQMLQYPLDVIAGTKWFEAKTAPISRTFDGKRAVFAVILDITQRKLNEEELRRKTFALTASNKNLEQFAYVASHDLQEPLNTINNYVQLLRRRYGEHFDERGLMFLQNTADAAMKMRTLIKDLLAFSKLHQRSFTFDSIDGKGLLIGVLRMLGGSIDEQQAEITYDPFPPLYGNGSLLSQLFQNLLSNAIKFHKPGESPQIHISVLPLPAHWQFTVKDNGIGIDSKYHSEIFVLFRRLNSHDDYEGTGIGLPLCKRIVELHGGAIRVESSPGEGASFIFTLQKVPSFGAKIELGTILARETE